MMSDKQIREHLKELKAEESRKDKIFSRVQAISGEFEGGRYTTSFSRIKFWRLSNSEIWGFLNAALRFLDGCSFVQ
jgi:hypothetical protein